MNRQSLVAPFALVAGVVAALSAQGTSSNSDVNQKTIQSIRVKVIGCVAGGSEAGHYRLTDAVLSGDDIPSTAGTAGKAGSGQDLSFENSPSFDLIGGRLQAHVGHKVEVIGITSDTKLNNSDSLNAAIGSSTQEKGECGEDDCREGPLSVCRVRDSSADMGSSPCGRALLWARCG